MKKLVLKGMAALFSCAAFVSCSHDTDFQSTHNEQVFDNLKNQYSANFIKKYGEIDPNQSWDFANYEYGSNANTRSGGTVESNQKQEGANFYGMTIKLILILVFCFMFSKNSEILVNSKNI